MRNRLFRLLFVSGHLGVIDVLRLRNVKEAVLGTLYIRAAKAAHKDWLLSRHAASAHRRRGACCGTLSGPARLLPTQTSSLQACCQVSSSLANPLGLTKGDCNETKASPRQKLPNSKLETSTKPVLRRQEASLFQYSTSYIKLPKPIRAPQSTPS